MELLPVRDMAGGARQIARKFKSFLVVFLASLLVIGAGTVGYVLIEGAPVISALYMTVITVTTIGYGEIFPLSTHGRIFTMGLAFAGVGIIMATATEVARVVLEGDLQRLLGLPREARLIKQLSNHIVVGGYGRMGRAVVEVLEEQKVPFAVVETDLERCRPLVEARKAVVHGDATHHDALVAAGIDRARTFIACLHDDAHNTYAILLARQLNPNVKIIARAVEEDSETRLRLAGAHRVINPYRLGGTRLAQVAIKPTVVEFLDESLRSSGMDVELAEVEVGARGEVAGRTLAEAGIRKNFGIIVIGLKRKDEKMFNPDASTRILAGDMMIVLGPVQAISRFVAAAAKV